MKSCVMQILLVLLSCGIATGGEHSLSLLEELVHPQPSGTAVANGTAGQHSSSVGLLHLYGMPELVVLEELEEEDGVRSDLDLPDDSPAADIPLTLNEQVEDFISFFQNKGRRTYSIWLSRSTRYLPLMQEILRKEGLPEELGYLAMIESGFQLHARSHANAVGPWQFISATGRRYSLRIDHWVDERKDPVKATVAAAMYLKDLYGLFNNDWYLAAAGYNAGENKIFRAIEQYETSDFWELTKGSYLKRETKEYVPKLLAATIIAKDPTAYGFTEVTKIPVVESDTVMVRSQTDLELVARLTGTTYETIKELNPALHHWCTPPDYPDYELRIPKGTKPLFEAGIVTIPEEQRFTEKKRFHRYTATRKDSLHKIARRFGSTPTELAQLNGLRSKHRIAGKTLLVPVAVPTEVVAAKPENRPKADLAAARYYTVRKGDTLYALARRFNVSAKLLAAWNNLKSAVALMPGKRLIVAKGSASGRAG